MKPSHRIAKRERERINRQIKRMIQEDQRELVELSTPITKKEILAFVLFVVIAFVPIIWITQTGV